MSPAPLFLCGVARSGTTYLLTLLNAAAPIRLTYESRLIREGLGLAQQLPPHPDIARFARFVDELIAGESENIRNMALIATLRRHQPALYASWQQNPVYGDWIQQVYALAYPEKPIWGDKLLRVEQVNWLRQVWPSARILILYRDPRAVAASQKSLWQSANEVIAGYWNTHLNLSQVLLAEMGERALAISYEQLLQEPETTLGRILHFIEPGLEQETQAILSAHPPKTASLHKWRQQLTATDTRQIEAYCFAGMQALGYQPELATEARPLRRASYLWHLGQTFKGVLTRPRLILRKRLWERLRVMLQTQNDNK